MPYRYNNRSSIELTEFDFPKQIKTLRKMRNIRLYLTPRFNRITDDQLGHIEFETHTWTRGDKFYRLAYDHYGDVRYWWAIALFNNAPTEHHIIIGQEILIPTSPELVARILGVE
mgnify:CR=1 FL=1